MMHKQQTIKSHLLSGYLTNGHGANGNGHSNGNGNGNGNGHSNGNGNGHSNGNGHLPEVLIITSYPPRECGIATYSQDLATALTAQFGHSFTTSICALESSTEKHEYNHNVKYVFDTDNPDMFTELAADINQNRAIHLVILQHEFGFFNNKESELFRFMQALNKPLITVFHTVLPKPTAALKKQVIEMVALSTSVIVMTQTSEKLLRQQYGIPKQKINVIPHGTHLVQHADKMALKQKWGLSGRKILSTFGLLSAGKNIETTLRALPAIIKHNPDVLFLIMGKTHPTVHKHEGNRYRAMLDALVEKLDLQQHVQFIHYYLPLPDLLEYLQLTDVYLFTSHDPNQAVSGTFSYALSCGCPVVSTPIPHAVEVLGQDAGMIIDFESSLQLSEAVNALLANDTLAASISMNGLHRITPTVWQNSAIAHAILIEQQGNLTGPLQYTLPPVNLDHINKMTTHFGMVQFACINQPDIDSGYTLDDNARALIAICQHYELTKNVADIRLITIYLDFIAYCLQPEGIFLNYVNEQYEFTPQNNECNLADANGRAIWALGYLLSLSDLLPKAITIQADEIMQTALLQVNKIHSTRAMAFIIKGLYYRNLKSPTSRDVSFIKHFANRLVQMYRHEAIDKWQWFESYLTYANGILPEAMLCAWMATGEPIYKTIAVQTFDFLLTHIFKGNRIRVISNKTWLAKCDSALPKVNGGEQPIDVAYTVMALSKFYDALGKQSYLTKMQRAFNWFLGSNHLHQIVYNPCTGGCYDGLEEHGINLNQGAESAVSYLMARLTLEKYQVVKPIIQKTKTAVSIAAQPLHV